MLLVGGWSFSLYLLQLTFKNLREICKSYWRYLLGGCEPLKLCSSAPHDSRCSCKELLAHTETSCPLEPKPWQELLGQLLPAPAEPLVLPA